MTEKSITERVINNLLLLYLIRQASRLGRVEDDLKVQKLTFLAEKQLVQKKLRGLTYNFFRWHRGPYCASLSNDIQALTTNGLLERTPSGIRLTKDGQDLVSQCDELLARNSMFTGSIDSVLKDYASLPPDKIKETVYKMAIFVPKLRKMMTIEDVPQGQLILFNLSEKKARGVFDLDESWLATLELVLDADALDSLKASQEDAINGRTCTPTL
jgi:uncharacterized protein YwgA